VRGVFRALAVKGHGAPNNPGAATSPQCDGCTNLHELFHAHIRSMSYGEQVNVIGGNVYERLLRCTSAARLP
jgi:hypothetical protein